MTTKDLELRVAVKVAWWVRPYLFVVAAWCVLTRTEPNLERVSRVLSHGIKVL